MTRIKFGTNGWQAVIARDYTEANVKRIAEATAKWIQQNGGNKVVIGHDDRFGGQMFAEAAACVMGAYGIKVNLAKVAITTPMVSIGVLKTKSDLGIVIAADDKPSSYNGYLLTSKLGIPLTTKDISEVEALTPDTPNLILPTLEDMLEKGLLNYIDLEDLYHRHHQN